MLTVPAAAALTGPRRRDRGALRPRAAGSRWAWHLVALTLVASPATTAGAEDWVRARGPNFTVLSNAGEGRARRVAGRFELLRALFAGQLGLRVDPGAPILIFAVKDERSMKRLLPAYAESGRGWMPAGLFVSRVDGALVVLRADLPDEQSSVVFHEYVHLLTDLNFARLPVWLNEGLAQFYETLRFRNESVEVGRIQPHLVQTLRNATLLPLDEFLTADRTSRYYNERNRVSIFYAQAAVLTHYLAVEHARIGTQPPPLLELVRLLDEGVPDEQAHRRALGDLGKLETQLRSYASRPAFVGYEIGLRIEEESILVEPLPPKEAEAAQGELLASMGRPAEARERLEGLPPTAQILEAMGRVLLREGRREEAARSFAEAAARDPQRFASHYWEAVLGAAEGREAGLEAAIRANAAFAPAYAALAQLQLGQKRYAAAFDNALKAAALRPTELSYRVTLMQALEAGGYPDKAAELEEDLRRTAAGDPDALAVLTSHYRRHDREGDADTLLQVAHSHSPTNLRIVGMLGGHLVDDARYEEAEAVYRRGLEAHPDTPWLLNALGYMNADRDVRVTEALKLIERALDSDPRNPGFLDSRGWALYRLGQLEDAEKTFRKAVEEGASDPVVLDHFGDVLAARGRRSEAAALWSRALAHDAASEELKATIEKKLASDPSSDEPLEDRSD